MATTKTNEALTTGLLICDRISDEGLMWIKRNDPSLFGRIQDRRNGRTRPRRRKR